IACITFRRHNILITKTYGILLLPNLRLFPRWFLFYIDEHISNIEISLSSLEMGQTSTRITNDTPCFVPGTKRSRISESTTGTMLSTSDTGNEDDRDSDSGGELLADRSLAVPTSVGMTENDTARKRSNSLNDSEDGSPEPGSQSPTHTPPLTPALTPQREDTPAPENLSLRKSGSPLQTQQTLQPVDLVQPRPSPPLPSLAAAATAVHFPPYAPLYGPAASSLYCSPAKDWGTETGRGCLCVTGDVVSAMEVLVCEDNLQPKSAFSPLAGALASAAAASASVSAAYASRAAYCTTPIPSTRHRFLAAPYAGTGYLPTVIKPPNQSLHANGTGDAYRETSPDDASDKTSYSE
ncbi:hypothetical protein E2986_08293, partial [Frieseomelitta varia]